jgi:hypothetical protein
MIDAPGGASVAQAGADAACSGVVDSMIAPGGIGVRGSHIARRK